MSKEKFFDFQRRHQRKPYRAEIAMFFNERLYRGTISNLSLGGAFIVIPSVNQFSVGDVVTISIPYPNGKRSVKRKAEVRWMNNEGLAVEFLFMSVE